MQSMTPFLTLTSAFFVLAATTTVLAEKEYGPGVSDTEIKIGQTMPYSGPTTATATIAFPRPLRAGLLSFCAGAVART